MTENQLNLNNKQPFKKDWFYLLSIRLTKGDLASFVLISFLISLGDFYFQPIALLGSAGLALSLSKLNLEKIIKNTALVITICFAIAYLYQFINVRGFKSEIGLDLLMIVIQVIIPALVIAFSFKLSKSLSLSLIVLLDWMFLLSLLLIPFYQDILFFIESMLNNFLNNPALKELTNANIFLTSSNKQNLASSIIAIFFGSLYIQYFLIAMIAKKWLNQSLNLNFSYSDEFVNIKAFDWMGFIMILSLLMVYWFSDIVFLKMIFSSLVAYFFLIGLATVHSFFRQRKLSTGVIIFAYIIIFLFMEISLVLLNTIAVGRCLKNFLIKTNNINK